MPMPRNIEAEYAVLGAILKEPEMMDMADEIFKGDEFYHPGNQKIFAAMRDVSDEGNPIDLVMVASKLQDKGQLEMIGGIGHLSEIIQSVPTAANFSHYAGIVKEKAVHRNAILEIQLLQHEAATTDDPAKLIARMQSGSEALADQTVKKQEFQPLVDVARDCFVDIEQRFYTKDAGGLSGIPSGFEDLDHMTAGFQKSDLIIVAARPSVGKTAFALNIAQSVAVKKNEPVGIFSLEMGAKQLVSRMICSEGRIDASRLRTGNLQGDDWEKITMAMGTLSEAPIYIDDSPALTVYDIRSRCKKLKKEKGLGLILIDYLQLLSSRGKNKENRQQEVSEISRMLKQIARELEVPVIALSQLSRSVEQRQDKRPMLSDLRESGSIEQDADIVAFLYRDDYYDKETEKKNIIEIIIAKQRNGPVGTVELAFLKNYNKFVSLDRGYQSSPAPQPPRPPIDFMKNKNRRTGA
jgi:replicative DNA helicase